MPLISYIYSIPYLAVFFILLFLALNEVGKLHMLRKADSRKIAFLVMLVFIGLRGHLGSDFIGYYPFYNRLPIITELSLVDLDSTIFEPGFVIYSAIIKTIFPDYFAWVFINTLLDLLVVYYLSRRYSISTIFTFIAFLGYWGLGIEINLYRNSKAMMLFLLSLPYLERRSLLPYLGLNILGCTFHTSSIVYLPLYFVLHREIPKKWVWALFVFSNVVFFLSVSLSSQLQSLTLFVDGILGTDKISAKAELWQSSKTYGGEYGFTIGYFERLLFFMLFTFGYQNLIRQRTSNRIFYNSFLFLYVSLHLLSPISSEIAKRITYLFAFSYWFLLPNFLLLIEKKRLFFMALLMLFMIKVGINGGNLAMKYSNILVTSKDDYAERKRNVFRVFSAGRK